MSAVSTERHGPVAVLRMNNPPVNGLGAALRRAVSRTRSRAFDPAVEAIVLIGEGRMYSAGADIREFNSTPAAGDTRTSTR